MEWKEVRLGDICDLTAGYAFKAKDFGDYQTKVIRIGDIIPPFISYESATCVDIAKYDLRKLQKYIVNYGDYVLAMTGATIGKIGRYTQNTPSYINQRVLKFCPTKNVDRVFVYYLINTTTFGKYIINHIDSESAQPNISANTISKYEVKIPSSIEDQRRIAAILSSLDRKIELNNMINAQLEEMAQAIFKSWFVDFEPFKVGADGSAPTYGSGKFVDSELGMIPEGWRVSRAEDIYNINIGKTPPRKESHWFSTNVDDNVWVSIADMGSCGVFISDSSEYLTDAAVDKHNVIMVEKNTVLLSFKLTVGRVAIADTKLTTNEAIARFNLPSDNHMEYLYLLLKQYDYNSLGSTSSIATAVNSKTIKGMRLLLPTDNIIQVFSSRVKPLFNRIRNLSKESLHLSHLRDTLLPKLMSGEIEI